MRPYALTSAQAREVKALHVAGTSVRKIADKFGVSAMTVQRTLTEERYADPLKPPKLSGADRIAARFAPGARPRYGRC